MLKHVSESMNSSRMCIPKYDSQNSGPATPQLHYLDTLLICIDILKCQEQVSQNCPICSYFQVHVNKLVFLLFIYFLQRSAKNWKGQKTVIVFSLLLVFPVHSYTVIEQFVWSLFSILCSVKNRWYLSSSLLHIQPVCEPVEKSNWWLCNEECML